jgi:hypothetical protein
MLEDDVDYLLVNGLDGPMPRSVVSRPMMKAILQTASRLGLRPSRSARIVGGYALERLVDEGAGYQGLAQRGQG